MAKAKAAASTRLKIAARREFRPSPLAPSFKIAAKSHGDEEEKEEKEEEELRQVESLLAQIWHRNKNQHRGQKWWKWVSVLKRGLRDLGRLDGTGGEAVGAVVGAGWEGEGVKGAERDMGEAEMVRRRMVKGRARREGKEQVERWLREVVLGRCWL